LEFLTFHVLSFKILQNFFSGGGGGPNKAAQQLEDLLSKLEGLQADLLRVKSTLTNAASTQFVVVSIPTQLAVLESRRLVQSLHGQVIMD